MYYTSLQVFLFDFADYIISLFCWETWPLSYIYYQIMQRCAKSLSVSRQLSHCLKVID